eukprot:snap_masked-scaffold_1-processed-gene-8.31-mRNA-1 protein AED:1.00 eAED:1.00 QI:0/0/0/0/1/1/2/0/64
MHKKNSSGIEEEMMKIKHIIDCLGQRWFTQAKLLIADYGFGRNVGALNLLVFLKKCRFNSIEYV